LKLTRLCFSNYAALTYSIPTAHEAPTSLQAFTEDELMLKDTGKFPAYLDPTSAYYVSAF
jgi:hypothetical protein